MQNYTILQIGTNFVALCQFLTQRELAVLTRVHSKLRSQLLKGQCWGKLQISDYNKSSWPSYLKWVQKYIQIICPYWLQLSIHEQQHAKQLLSILKVYPFVGKLSVYCQSSQLHIAIANACPAVTQLKLSSHVVTDKLFSKMVAKMSQITQLQIYKADLQFQGTNINTIMNNSLQKIVMKPHMIDFDEIGLLTCKSADTLWELQLDVEDCSNEQLINIIGPLHKLQVLRLFHMENIACQQKLSSILSTRIRELYLTKTQKMPLEQIIRNIAAKSLVSIDLTESYTIGDMQCMVLAQKAENLKHVNLSWCNNVNDKGISGIITSCLKLQTLIVNGNKALSDSAFIEYQYISQKLNENAYDRIKNNYLSEVRKNKQHANNNNYNLSSLLANSAITKMQSIRTLRNIRYLECINCNNVSDRMLKAIYIVNTKCKVINYYNDQMGLYSYNEIGDNY